jgi:hypothetical protein
LGGQVRRERPSRGLRPPWPSRATSPPHATTLSGFRRLSELHSARRSGDMGFAAPSSPSPRPRGLPSSGLPVIRGPRAAPSGLRALSGFQPRHRLRSEDRSCPSWGFSPSSDTNERIRCSRACLTRHVPSTGFFAPSTVSSPPASRSRGPLPLLGFSALCETLSSAGRNASPRPYDRLPTSAPASRALRNTR